MRRVEELRERTVWKSDPHTQVKHLVYRHYLQCWMGKIVSGQNFPHDLHDQRQVIPHPRGHGSPPGR